MFPAVYHFLCQNGSNYKDLRNQKPLPPNLHLIVTLNKLLKTLNRKKLY